MNIFFYFSKKAPIMNSKNRFSHIILLFLTLLFTHQLTYAQSQYLWAKQFEGNNTIIENLSPNSNSDFWAIKQDNSGNELLLLSKSSGNTLKSVKISGDRDFKVHDIQTDANGQTYILGTFRKNFAWGNFTKEYEKWVNRTFIAKLDKNGEIQEAQMQIFENVYLYKMNFTSQGEILLGGDHISKANLYGEILNSQGTDVIVIILDKNFNKKNLFTIKSFGNNTLHGIYINPNNMIYLSMDIMKMAISGNDTIPLPKGIYKSHLLLKVSRSGKIAWGKTFPMRTNCAYSGGELSELNGKLFFGINFSRYLVIGNDSIISGGRKDLALCTVNSNGGNLKLLHHFKSRYDVNLFELKTYDKKIYLAGNFFVSLDIPGKRLIVPGDTTGYQLFSDGYLLALNEQGELQSHVQIGDLKSDQLKSVLFYDDCILVSGQFNGVFKAGNTELSTQYGRPSGFIASLKNTSSNNSNPDCVAPGAPAILASSGLDFSKFTANWKKVDDAKYYHIKLGTNRNMDALIKEEYNLSKETNAYTFTGLASGERYYYQVIAENDCGKQAKSKIASEKIKCKVDYFFLDDPANPGCTFFVRVDCHGKMTNIGYLCDSGGVVINPPPPDDTIEGRNPEDPEKSDPGMNPPIPGKKPPLIEGEKSKDPKKSGPSTNPPIPRRKPLFFGTMPDKGEKGGIGSGPVKDDGSIPIEPYNPSSTKEPKTKYIPVSEIFPPSEEAEVETPPVFQTSPCVKLDDKEKIICLAKEGYEKVQTLKKRIVNVREALEKEFTENKYSQEEALKIATEKQGVITALEKQIDSIRKEYGEFINAIAAKRSIKIPVLNNSGFTVEDGVVYEGRWNKYDDAFKTPGPQLLVEFKISDFNKKLVGVNKDRCESVESVQREFIMNDGSKPYGRGRLLVWPCAQVRGSISNNVAVIDQFENLGKIEFNNTMRSSWRCETWEKCKGASLKKGDPDWKINRENAYWEAFKAGFIEGGKKITEGMLITGSLIMAIRTGKYIEASASAVDYFSWATASLADPYFEICGKRSEFLDFMKETRKAVEFGTSGFSNYKGYKTFMDPKLLGDKKYKAFSELMVGLLDMEMKLANEIEK